jgi:hypothetical protein
MKLPPVPELTNWKLDSVTPRSGRFGKLGKLDNVSVALIPLPDELTVTLIGSEKVPLGVVKVSTRL